MSESSSPNPCPCTKNKWFFLILGILGLAGAYYGVFGKGLGLAHAHDENAYRPMYSLIIGSTFWFSILIGMLLLVMITRIFDAGWAPVIRRQWEHFIGALPWVVIFGVFPLLHPEVRKTVWEWMNPEHVLVNGHTVGHDSVLAAKSWYLNESFFYGRMAFYLVFFTAVPYAFRHLSYKQDKDPQLGYTTRAHALSVGSMLFTALGITALIIDLSMSLSYHWFSTMYGVWFFTACIRASLAFTVIISGMLAWKGWLRGLYNRAHRHVLGSMMLAFTVFWAYISFSQYFIIYNANVPEETYWYNMREFIPHVLGGVGKNQWWWVSMGLLFGHFFMPFFALLFYKTKVHTKLITGISVWILAVGFLDLYFNIVPRQLVNTAAADGYLMNTFIDANMVFDASAVIGLGGVVMFVFLHSASKQQPVPIHDPRILESISYHE
jgi:hypothetical protein